MSRYVPLASATGLTLFICGKPYAVSRNRVMTDFVYYDRFVTFRLRNYINMTSML
jgi:hypothetical protein